MPWEIITGGQTGVDTGALMAANVLGIPWRAVFPNGYRREKPAPSWMMARAFEMGRYGYDERTRYCVRRTAESNGRLLLLGEDLNTPGTRLTRQLAEHYGLKILDTRENMENGFLLMVAGPRGSKWPEGASVAYKTIKKIIPFIPDREWKREYLGEWVEP